MMSGVVIAYAKDVFAGVLQAQDGKKYTFHRKDWPAAVKPKKGEIVEFDRHNNTAVKIRLAVQLAA